MKYIPILCLFFLSCQKEEYVDYKYWCGGSAGDYAITIHNSDGNTQQWSNVGSGFEYRWKQTGTRWLYISAQNNTGQGDVTVSIYRDGKVVNTNTSYGAYAIATASGEY